MVARCSGRHPEEEGGTHRGGRGGCWGRGWGSRLPRRKNLVAGGKGGRGGAPAPPPAANRHTQHQRRRRRRRQPLVGEPPAHHTPPHAAGSGVKRGSMSDGSHGANPSRQLHPSGAPPPLRGRPATDAPPTAAAASGTAGCAGRRPTHLRVSNRGGGCGDGGMRRGQRTMPPPPHPSSPPRPTPPPVAVVQRRVTAAAARARAPVRVCRCGRGGAAAEAALQQK